MRNSSTFQLFSFSCREIEELREQKVVLHLQVEELQTRVHSLTSLKQADQEVEVSLLLMSSGSRRLRVVEEPVGGSIRLNISI